MDWGLVRNRLHHAVWPLPWPTMCCTRAPLPDELPDLQQLLDSLKFGHWHSVVLALCSRFEGWWASYMADPALSPDYRPLFEAMDLIRRFPLRWAGDDKALALALSECEFLARGARECFEGQIAWDCTAETFTTFAKRHPHCYALWDAQPACGQTLLIGWMLHQLRANTAT
jgi:hypothetical protein